MFPQTQGSRSSQDPNTNILYICSEKLRAITVKKEKKKKEPLNQMGKDGVHTFSY